MPAAAPETHDDCGREDLRAFIRIALAIATVASVVICAMALRGLGPSNPAAWATVAAALAVLAAVASAWTSQRVLEIQEDALQPNPVPAIDLRSRASLAQFRITNHGGTDAHDVAIIWDEAPPGRDGNPVPLGATPIRVIPEGESASVLLTSSHDFLAKNPDTTFAGTVHFKDPRGREYSRGFTVTAEHERDAMLLVTDEQEFRQSVKEIAAAVKEIAKSLGRS